MSTPICAADGTEIAVRSQWRREGWRHRYSVSKIGREYITLKALYPGTPDTRVLISEFIARDSVWSRA